MSVTPLEWDSSFFGYSVASASFQHSAGLILEVQVAIQEARVNGAQLLYLFMPKVEEHLRTAIEQIGARSMGQKVDFVKTVSSPTESRTDPDIDLCHAAHPQLERLAMQSGIHSRFRLDEGFQHQEYERLYREWLRTSLEENNNKQVLVAGDAAAPHGFITLELGKEGRIGLLAVDAAQRGQGLGARLMTEAERICSRHQITKLSVATQSQNTGACHFYETYGFTRRSEVDIFHVWPQPKPPVPPPSLDKK